MSVRSAEQIGAAEGQAYVHTRRARRAKRQAPRCPPSLRAAAAKKVVRQNDLLVPGGGRGIPASPAAKADPSLASSVGRIPENVPLARFLNGIPPHRFESLFPITTNAPLTGRCKFSGGGRGIRTLVTWITGKTVFETAAFNHSAIPPYSVRCTIRKRRQMRAYKKSPVNLGDGVNKWRRDGDSNPRYAFGAYTISNRAPSASSDISPFRQISRNAICIVARKEYNSESEEPQTFFCLRL